MEKKTRALRKKWLLPLAEMPVWQAINWVENAKQRQLKCAVAAMESCTQTNCWFGLYGTAQLLLPHARKLVRPNAEFSGERSESAATPGYAPAVGGEDNAL